MTREPIYAALAAYFAGLTVGGAAAFKLATRVPKHWQDVAAEDCPALLLRPVSETAEARRGLPPKWALDVELLLYVRHELNENASALLNPLLDAIEAALQTTDPQTGSSTLGGIVSSAMWAGPVQLHLGTLDNEAVAICPIRVVVAG